MPPRRQQPRQKQQQQIKQQLLQQQHQPIAQKQSPSQQTSKHEQDLLGQQHHHQQENLQENAQCDQNTHEQASQAISDEKRKEIIHKDVQEMLENDLNCAICRDIYINPLILNCSHSFCKYCVYLWLSKKPGCPTCRMTVTFQAENLALRNIINRMIQKSSQQYQTNRSSVVSQRLKDEEQQQKDGVVPKMTLKPSTVTNASNSNQGGTNGSRAGGDNMFQLRAFRRGVRRRNLEGMFSVHSSHADVNFWRARDGDSIDILHIQESSEDNVGADDDDENDDDYVTYPRMDSDNPLRVRALLVRSSSDESSSTLESSGDDADDYTENDMDDENEDDDVYVDLDVTGDSDHNNDDDEDISNDSDESVWDGHFSDDIVDFNEDGDDEIDESDTSSDTSSSSSSSSSSELSDSSMSAVDDDNSYDASFRDVSYDEEPSSEDSTEEYEVEENDSDELVISWDSDALERYSRESSVEYATSSDEYST